MKNQILIPAAAGGCWMTAVVVGGVNRTRVCVGGAPTTNPRKYNSNCVLSKGPSCQGGSSWTVDVGVVGDAAKSQLLSRLASMHTVGLCEDPKTKPIREPPHLQRHRFLFLSDGGGGDRRAQHLFVTERALAAACCCSTRVPTPQSPL
jgi:hypothetical protein